MASRTNRVLTDHNEIRRWAEERKASPACVRGTGGNNDIGMLRLDFPGYTGARSLEHIGWNDWFDKFDERGLALLVQDQTARGERSNFNKIVSRETAAASQRGRSRSSARSSRASAGRRTGPRKRTAASSRTRTPARKAGAASPKGRSARKTASTSRRSSVSTRAKASRKTSRRTASAGSSRSAAARRTSASTRSESTRARRKTSTRTQASRRSNEGRRSNVRSIESGRRSASSHVLTDHGEIRRWAEERKAAPACVRGTGGRMDPGMIRLDFPGFSGARSLQHIEWDDWFRAFDDNQLALLVQDTRAAGGRSNFNKLISRETAEHRARGEGKWSRRHPEKGATSRTRGAAENRSTSKETRGSTRARRTESVRGRTTSHRRAA